METSFNESQRFKQFWVWLILIMLFGIWLWAIFQQLILGIPFGNKPAPDVVLIIFGFIPFIMLVLFLSARLQTRVSQEGILFRYLPFHRRYKKINYNDIETYRPIQYHPLTDYGGWGIRYGIKSKGRAYNVEGNMGIQLKLKNDQYILIGTKRPQAFQEAIEKHISKPS